MTYPKFHISPSETNIQHDLPLKYLKSIDIRLLKFIFQMSRLLFSRFVKASAFLGLGTCSLIGYKAYRKSLKHPNHIQYNVDDNAKYDKNNVEFKLKSRQDHLNEALHTDYDVLIIGKLYS